jgi:uncharacterized protein YfaP (DUF2135 family)
MKKVLLALTLVIVSLTSFAQKQVTLKAGSIVPLQAINQVKAADVEEGQTVDFQVVQDVNVDGICAIPRGTLVKGKVSEARKSSLAGTKGRLVINISSMNLPNGEPVFFSNTDVRINGKNRTPLAVVTGLFFWPCIFIPGTKAVMPSGYEVQATVAANTTITVK